MFSNAFRRRITIAQPHRHSLKTTPSQKRLWEVLCVFHVKVDHIPAFFLKWSLIQMPRWQNSFCRETSHAEAIPPLLPTYYMGTPLLLWVQRLESTFQSTLAHQTHQPLLVLRSKQEEGRRTERSSCHCKKL